MGGVIALASVLTFTACTIGEGERFLYNGKDRSYELYTPPSLDKRSGKNKPLLLVLHGNPSNGWETRMYSGMNKAARKGDFIVVYPDARTGKWPFTDQSAIDEEVGYISALLDHICELYPVDTSRIYTSGISGGGIFSFLLADRLPNKFAAIAVVAGNLPKSIELPHEMQPVPLVLFHGTDDFLYEGREDLFSVDSTLAIFTAINSCNVSPAITHLEDKKNDNTTVELVEYECGTPVKFYRINNGGHHWPGGNFNADRFTKLELGEFCRDIDASELIWEFLSERSK